MKEIRLIIASDSVGETAELVTKACVSQFNLLNNVIDTIRLPYIETTENVDEVINLSKEQESIVVYTLVKPAIRKYMQQQTLRLLLLRVSI